MKWGPHGPSRAELLALREGPRHCCACDEPLTNPWQRYVCGQAECKRLWRRAIDADYWQRPEVKAGAAVRQRLRRAARAQYRAREETE